MVRNTCIEPDAALQLINRHRRCQIAELWRPQSAQTGANLESDRATGFRGASLPHNSVICDM